ncbi:MAG: hypothetical protein OXC98_06105, partial [bacterium]|nr:hypothetical protein [bacterium]
MKPRRQRPHVLIGILGVMVLALFQVPLAGAQPDEAEAARQRVAELDVQQQQLALLIEETWVAQVVAEEELDRIAEELRNAESDLWLAKSALEDLAVTLYMDVTTGKNVSLWLSDGPEGFEAGVGYLEVLGIEEEAVWSRYRTVTDGLGRQEDQYKSQLSRLDQIRAEQEALFSQLLEALEAAQQELVLLESLGTDSDEPSTTTAPTTTTTAPTTTTTAPTTTTTAPTTTTTAPTTTTTAPTTTTTAPT